MNQKDEVNPKLLIQVVLIVVLVNLILLRFFPLRLPLTLLVPDYVILAGINAVLVDLTLFPNDCMMLVKNIRSKYQTIFEV